MSYVIPCVIYVKGSQQILLHKGVPALPGQLLLNLTCQRVLTVVVAYRALEWLNSLCILRLEHNFTSIE